MNKVMTFLQLMTWFFAACYFCLLTAEHLRVKPTHNEIITQLEQQVNFELE